MKPPLAFAEMSGRIYDPNTWFDSWPQIVRGICEADSFAQFALWERWAEESDYQHLGPVRWKQRNPGTLVRLPGELFDTSVSLSVDEIDGHPVLFWYCTSARCDWELAREWVERSFPMAVDADGRRNSHDASNFHNVVHGIRGR